MPLVEGIHHTVRKGSEDDEYGTASEGLKSNLRARFGVRSMAAWQHDSMKVRCY